MDDDYNFTSVSRYERDLFNAYVDGDDKTKSELWDQLKSFYPEKGYEYLPIDDKSR